MNVTAWRTKDGTVRLLAANLEEGLRDDADMTRHATMILPKSWKATRWLDAWTRESFDASHGDLKIDLGQAKAVLLGSVSRVAERHTSRKALGDRQDGADVPQAQKH
jgi:hypothetical protein